MKKFVCCFLFLVFTLAAVGALADREAEPVLMAGGVSKERAVLIDSSLAAYPIEMQDLDQYVYFYFIADMDDVYYFCVKGSLDAAFYHESGRGLDSGTLYSGTRLFAFDLEAGERIDIAIRNYGDNNPKLTFCYGTHHVRADEAHLTRPVTCCEDGQRAYLCSYCSQLHAYETIPAQGHTLGEWGYYPAATCTQDGQFAQQCTVCGELVNAINIPMLGHCPSEPVIVLEATERQQGLLVVECTTCGEILSTEILPVLQ